jgi:hypothetical protein
MIGLGFEVDLQPIYIKGADTVSSTAGYILLYINSHKACFNFRKNLRNLSYEGDARPETVTCLWFEDVAAIFVLLTVNDAELLFVPSTAVKAL